MKHHFISVGVLAVLGLLFVSAPVGAQSASDGGIMTDAHIQRIKQNCRAASRTIQQMHVNDGPLRVNRGQVYDSVSSKLMTPLNSRLIVNKLDASSLVKLTAQYDKALTDFRESYKKYDNQVSNVLKIDCAKQPVSFYDAVAEARKQRGTVHGHVVRLHELIKEYGTAFGTFRERFDNGQAKGGDQ